MKPRAGLILCNVAAGTVFATSVDEAIDLEPVLSVGPRHRLRDHRKRRAQHHSIDMLTDSHDAALEGRDAMAQRLLARKQKKKKKRKHESNKSDNDEDDEDKERDESDMKKTKKKDKKKVKKVKKNSGAKLAEKKMEKVKEDSPSKQRDVVDHKEELKKVPTADTTKVEEWSDWNASNGCICNDWTGDAWSKDSWVGGDHSLPIGWDEDGWDVNDHYKDYLKHLRADIVQLIEDSDRALLPKCLRLAFHDCIDGCDGCIDVDVLDNRGLEDPVELLFPLVQKYRDKLSRADVWAYCAVVATDMAVIDNRPEDLKLHMHYIGRNDCKGADEKGFGGPEVVMYEPYLTTHEMIQFFHNRFGFDAYESVVLMGVHSAAVTHRENLGFGNLGRKDGWVYDAEQYKLSNSYYTSMIDNVWKLQKVENFGLVPDRYQWHFGEENNGPIMLTADMSLLWNFDGFIVTDRGGVEGKVTCRANSDEEFEVWEEGDPEDVPMCPMAAETSTFVEELGEDSTQFLFAFAAVLNKMITNGYDKHKLPMSKGGKSGRNKGKSGKGRNLMDSTDIQSTYSRDDVSETEGRMEQVNSAPSSRKKWCPC